MISNLISKAFWNSYEKHVTASQAEHQKTQAVLKNTANLSSNPSSLFAVKF